ncbi:hypothetical protein BJ878DRAFT_129584 [Calycina marina]|uniref:Uncharacterized protein n=1 Tax=Calycina marina TaxID=1763456 RepID=A0A9P7Z9M8_9HELO|nr:hypothetical protein BJ878DRAFT_129584 [Calycina marina]
MDSFQISPLENTSHNRNLNLGQGQDIPTLHRDPNRQYERIIVFLRYRNLCSVEDTLSKNNDRIRKAQAATTRALEAARNAPSSFITSSLKPRRIPQVLRSLFEIGAFAHNSGIRQAFADISDEQIMSLDPAIAHRLPVAPLGSPMGSFSATAIASAARLEKRKFDEMLDGEDDLAVEPVGYGITRFGREPDNSDLNEQRPRPARTHAMTMRQKPTSTSVIDLTQGDSNLVDRQLQKAKKRALRAERRKLDQPLLVRQSEVSEQDHKNSGQDSIPLRAGPTPPPMILTGPRVENRAFKTLPHGRLPRGQDEKSDLPFRTLNSLLRKMQSLLEDGLFYFVQKWKPDVLRRFGWEVPEQGELTTTAWWKAIQILDVPSEAVNFPQMNIDIKQTFERCTDIRHAAVHRLGISNERLRTNTMPAAMDILHGLKDVEREKVVRNLYNAFIGGEQGQPDLVAMQNLLGIEYEAPRPPRAPVPKPAWVPDSVAQIPQTTSAIGAKTMVVAPPAKRARLRRPLIDLTVDSIVDLTGDSDDEVSHSTNKSPVARLKSDLKVYAPNGGISRPRWSRERKRKAGKKRVADILSAPDVGPDSPAMSPVLATSPNPSHEPASEVLQQVKNTSAIAEGNQVDAVENEEDWDPMYKALLSALN